jgi:tyrosinase
VGRRKNQANLTPSEKLAFVNAILALKQRPSQLMPATASRYDDYVQMHMDSMMADPGWAHQGPAFLPWHREFLRRFELDLQTINPSVTIPYWDWTIDRLPTSSIWNSDFMGGNGRPSDGRVMDGPFAYDSGNWNLNISQDGSSDLKRRFGTISGSSILPTAQQVYECIDDPNGIAEGVPPRYDPYDSSPWDANAQPSFRNRLEGWYGPGLLHNRVHVWVGGQAQNGSGGTMLFMTSNNDPVFWLHHCFVDLLWARWQFIWGQVIGGAAYHPTGTPPEIGPAGHNLNDPMMPWGGATTPASVLNHIALGYWYDTDLKFMHVNTESHDFGNIALGMSADFTFSLTNSGGLQIPLTIENVIGPTSPAFTIISPPLPPMINYGETAQLTVRFSPTAQITYADSISVISDDYSRAGGILRLALIGSSTS